MKTSEEYYNELAKSYRSVSESRTEFIESINQYIVESAPTIAGGVRYLDIGAGDGYRSNIIIGALQPSHTTLLDNSAEMAGRIPQGDGLNVIISPIDEFESDMEYDLVTCLWNVLGHFNNADQRMQFFHKVKMALSKSGQLVLDVNNRYNINAYGHKSVMKNLSDDLHSKPDAGWFSLGDSKNGTRVYIHAPYEIDKMAEAAGLKVVDTKYVDYETGEFRDTFFEGQLLYLIKQQ